jgi:hypothetical protein
MNLSQGLTLDGADTGQTVNFPDPEHMKDFYSDSGALLTKLYGQSEDLPDFVKSAEFLVEQEDLAGLDSNAFADPSGRRFPTYDKAATFVSMAYFIAGDTKDQEVEGRLKRACVLFNLESEVKRLGDVIAQRKLAERSRKKEAAAAEADANPSWAIQYEGENRSLKRAGFGLDSFLSLCKDFLSINPGTEKMASLKEAAEEIVHEAQRLGGDFYTNVPDDILKLAGYGYPDDQLLEAYVGARAIGLPDDHSKRNFIETIHQLKTAAQKDLEVLPKLAEFIDRFDEEHNLKRFYGTKFPDPMRSVHNISTRKAAQLTAKVTVGKKAYYVAELDSDEAKRAALHVMGDDAYQATFPDGYNPKKLASLGDSLADSFNRIFTPGEAQPLQLV